MNEPLVGSQQLACQVQNSTWWDMPDAQETVGGNLERKSHSFPVAARREGRVAGDAERMMDGIFVGHLRTGVSLFSERELFRDTRVQRKTTCRRVAHQRRT